MAADRIPFFQFARDLVGYDYIRDSKVNMEMADFAERCVHAWLATRKKHRKRVKVAFIIPRKGRKSTIITQSLPPYMLLHDPNLSILIDSEMKQRSNDFLSATARVMAGETDSPWKDVLGSWKSRDSQWREDRVTINRRTYKQRKEPSMMTSSVEIGYTGGAPDAIGIDDPMSPESHTDLWMETVRNHYDGYGPVLMHDGLFWLCMTRYDDGDLYGHIERNEGVHVCDGETAERCIMRGQCTEATEDHPEPWHVLWKRAEDENGNSIDEVVWTTAFLKSEKKKYPGFYAGQYLNNPWHNPDAAYQPEDFVYSDAVPQDVTKTLTSDIAWKSPTDRKTERGGDWSSFITGYHQRVTGKVYIVAVKRGRWTQAEWGDELVRILRHEKSDKSHARRVPISRMTYEELKAGAKGAIAESIRSACSRWGDLCPALVQAPRSTVPDAKIERIKAAAIYFQNHQVVLVRPCLSVEYLHSCEKCNDFQVLRNELLKLGGTMYDDCADAMADHFGPGVYHAPAAAQTTALPPRPVRPFDDMLKPAQSVEEYEATVDDDGHIHWNQSGDLTYYPREPL